MHIDDALSQGVYSFKLGELCTAYEQRIQYFISDATVNKTRFKCELLDYYKQYGIQEQTDGRHVVLIFPKGMKTIVQNACFSSHCTSEASQLASVAKLLRSEISDMDNFTFDGNFPYDCQKDSVPYSLKLLISMILYGPSVDCIDTQSCPTISQLILFNFKKKQRMAETMTSTRPSLDREPPLPIYIGLNIHSLVRSKKLIEQLSNLGISITYDRVLQLEENRALSMCRQYQLNNIVCPSHLQKGHFIAGAMDNVDHNPSSTTADSSFHGTGISIVEYPSEDTGTIVQQGITPTADELSLPASYAIVPAVALNESKASVSARLCYEFHGNLENGILREQQWLKNALMVLESTMEEYKSMSWASFHANLQPDVHIQPATTALLPLFHEKADSPAMIKHAMDILQNVTSFLNPGQIPVMACDCPIFAKAKYIQWTWPATHGEDRFVVMFGGLHLEMGMWTTLGDYLACSGWTAALTEAGIVTAGKADSFLKTSHLTRTHRMHQLTCVALEKLQKEAFQVANSECSFEEWRHD